MRLMLAFVAVLAAASLAFAAGPDPRNWAQFRGPGGAGVSASKQPAIDFDLESGKNIAWRSDIPGLGLGSPIVFGDRIYLTTAVSANEQPLKTGLYGDIKSAPNKDPMKFQVVALDRETGKVVWTQTAYDGVPKDRRHPKASFANTSIATDGKHVVANFASQGLFCYDTTGKQLWKLDLGVLSGVYYMVPDAEWGFASSPVIHDGKLILQIDVAKDSRIMALDVSTGKPLWSTPRTDVPTWSTPTVITPAAGEPFVVANGFTQMRGYDLATGKQLFTLKGGGDIPVPTPIHAHGLIYFASAHGPAAPIFAVKETARGDVSLNPKTATSNEHIAWANHRAGLYMQSPIVVGERIFGSTDGGVMWCLEAKTGKPLYRTRLEGTGFTASPVSDGKRVFWISEDGNVNVVDATTDEFKSLAVISLKQQVLATPSLSDGMLLIRTNKQLIAVAPAK